MSPNDRQDERDAPRPFFVPAGAEDEGQVATPVFDSKPRDVKAWSFHRAPESISTPPAPEDVEPDREPEPEPEAVMESADEAEIDADSATEPDGEDRLENLDDLLGSQEDVDEVLDETLVDEEALVGEPEDPFVPCPNCEATEIAAAEVLEATIEAMQLPYIEGSEALQRAAQDASKDFVQNLLRLSVELAGAILRRTAAVDPEVVLGNLDSALEIAGPLTELTILCHPEDAELLRTHGAARAENITGRLVDMTIRADDSVGRGACIVDFGDSLVDARWQVQLERLADALSPTLIHHAAANAAELVAETMTPVDPEPVVDPGGDEQALDSEAPMSTEEV
ncbi:MAG: FliH/SctL family protein, partial [Myxococcota bacterium]|nr:FliH/SctL family protein [Myxococcota bacterium]